MEKEADQLKSHILDADIEQSSLGSSVITPKTAKDGTIVLDPQPSDDPNDPLNWSWWKKHAVFFTLLPGCLLTDGVPTWGSVLFEPQAMEWHKTPSAVANSLSPGVFLQGPGGLLAVPLCQRFGRLPVLFWSRFLTLCMTIGANLAPSYGSFTTFRSLQGFFGAPPQIIGLSLIYDLFPWHERARKINIWACCFLIGPYLLPMIAAFIVEVESWRNTWAVLTGFYAFSLLTIIFLGDETLYNHANPTQPRTGLLAHIQKLTGLTGYRASQGRPTIWHATKNLFAAILRPYLLLPTFGFITFETMWSIGLVNTVSLFILPPPYAFSQTAYGLLFFAPMIGTLLAEAFGHWFNDFLAARQVRRNAGVHVPEHRLWGVYPSCFVGVAGLVLYGQALQHTLHWAALAFGWGMAAFSVLGTTTPISAYILDIFPTQAAAGSAWILMARVAGGFSVTYFQAKWVAVSGPGLTFGLQGLILGVALVSVVTLQVWGIRMRQWWRVPEAKEV